MHNNHTYCIDKYLRYEIESITSTKNSKGIIATVRGTLTQGAHCGHKFHGIWRSSARKIVRKVAISCDCGNTMAITLLRNRVATRVGDFTLMYNFVRGISQPLENAS